MARALGPLKVTMMPWPPAPACWWRGRGPRRGGWRCTGEEGFGAGGEQGEGVWGVPKGVGVTRRVQGPGGEESEASREGLGEGT